MELKIRRPDNFHVHFRDGADMEAVVPCTARVYRRALVMPNTTVPITTGEQALGYKRCIEKAAGDSTFEALMTLKLTPETTRQTIMQARGFGVVAFKLYPSGATTNSRGGISDWFCPQFTKQLEWLAEAKMVLCVHAEDPSYPLMDREHAFLPYISVFLHRVPELCIVIEHLSTMEGVKLVYDLNRAGFKVAATITPQHLLYTVDDILCHNGRLDPHRFCYPVFKYEKDRAALIEAATSRDAYFFAGDDSAPHRTALKESTLAPPGCFIAPTSLQSYVRVFEKVGALNSLDGFLSFYGAIFYGLPVNPQNVKLINDGSDRFVDHIPVPEQFTPVHRGEIIQWAIAEVE